ncbi:hypothetical protein BO70DRAFT_44128 [Aspergillus heteromorphus CBS 117.55]|uniref:Uncharacterized protein n=1 Tax=Aspergillus heteromorphus CBS 117.55 TaxID=1448321 RepID=A0A317W7X7_9EURO|nr:uncharacterized protein BO70DRAFT_44128 [Aspergillus heteromorphus CBS 117.55]PWY81995.1 hypothetical protein BO70DRAFT_44128 [Aspergillus heteromorphus CBS 117.55]
MFRALKGIYLTPAGLSYAGRRRLANSFTVTLGPHGASFQDVLANIHTDLETVAKGFYSTIHGKQVLVTASVMALTGDMPQQAKNSGMLSYSADIGCRTCYCPRSKQYQWSYDTVSHGRYHFQHQYYRTEGDHKATVPEQQRYFNAVGIQSVPSPIERIMPTLDIVLGRPYDVPHSDWKGIGYRLLEYIQKILVPSGVSNFATALQKVVRPAQWPHFPPLKHLKTWTLSDLGRGIILLPIILRVCARPDWFHPRFLLRIKNIIPHLFPNTENVSSPQMWLVRACAEIALTTTLISTSRALPPALVNARITHSRRIFQHLVVTASAMTDSELQAFSIHGKLPHDYNKKHNKDKWFKYLGVPVVHAGFHFHTFAAEYGPLMNCNVLAGELKLYKNIQEMDRSRLAASADDLSLPARSAPPLFTPGSCGFLAG